jgi:hypothetical protein
MTLSECDSFTKKSIQMRRINMRKAEGANRVVTLLVGDDENDIRSIVVFVLVVMHKHGVSDFLFGWPRQLAKGNEPPFAVKTIADERVLAEESTPAASFNESKISELA